MGHRVRAALPHDVERLCEIRASRALQPEDAANGSAPRGGFLLGASEATYEAYVAAGCVNVLVGDPEHVVAFSVVLPDEAVRSSSIYARRHQSDLAPEVIAWLESQRVAYFDQLVAEAGLEGVSARLAYLHLIEAFERHDAVLATTVIAPVENRAALPFLIATGFEALGSIDESYPVIGELRSKIHVLTKHRFSEVRASSRAERFERSLRRSESRLSHDLFPAVMS